MRGSLSRYVASEQRIGIIPAHAGLTLKKSVQRISSRDHPRACGAHLILASVRPSIAGSSPRMRGSRSSGQWRCWQGGIIPAHAGLTATARIAVASVRDHPRACGAHCFSCLLVMLTTGSSPRMRGSHKAFAFSRKTTGIIPAHAGLTLHQQTTARRRRDHPRACGAHFCGRPSRCGNLGSSPRMRGSRLWLRCPQCGGGIIPAHAGLTKGRRMCYEGARDHPRACGAHVVFHHIAHWIKGSSPRMRGSLCPTLHVGAHDGIIPAHAGLTLACGQCIASSGDHPRACGAHFY